MANKRISLKAYKARLLKHEWFYEMFEDHQAYLDGRDEYKELRRLSNTSVKHLNLFNEIRDEKTQLSQYQQV